AGLNGLATVLLVVGFLLIKRGRPKSHETVMLTAFATSIVFLGCYLLYHYALHHYTGSSSRKYPSEAAGREIYLAILLSHVVLAAAVPLLAIGTIWHGWKANWTKHRRWAKITFPIWLYVSVTGVITYW